MHHDSAHGKTVAALAELLMQQRPPGIDERPLIGEITQALFDPHHPRHEELLATLAELAGGKVLIAQLSDLNSTHGSDPLRRSKEPGE